VFEGEPLIAYLRAGLADIHTRAREWLATRENHEESDKELGRMRATQPRPWMRPPLVLGLASQLVTHTVRSCAAGWPTSIVTLPIRE
jgi:hypothetical protein